MDRQVSALAIGAVLTLLAGPLDAAPSCDGGPGAGDDCAGSSCCSRLEVPTGSFFYVAPGEAAPDKVKVAGFALDKFEVTVGRFAAWVRAGTPLPADGTVLQRDVLGRPVKWTRGMRFATQRGKRLAGWRKYDTWSAKMFRAPKNSINWYTAAAFCHFDGGRLPTEHEWQYAAVGGDEQRLHPWGNASPTAEHAVYNCNGDGNRACDLADLLPVGSRPKGVGRWGHMDLAGSLFEWTTSGQGGGLHPDMSASHGGGFCYIGGVDRRAPEGLKATTVRRDKLDTVSHTVGVRCAYDLAVKPARGK